MIKRYPDPVANVEFVDVDKGRGVGPLSKIKSGLFDDLGARSEACGTATVAGFVCVELSLGKV